MDANFDVIVIGAGIFGASTAYHLQRMGGQRVLLIERGTAPGQGTTGASAAIIRQHYSNEILSRLTGESISILRDLESQSGRLFTASGWYFLVPEESLGGATENVAMQKAAGVHTRLMLRQEFEQEAPWLNPENVAAVVHEPDSGYADPVAAAEALVAAFSRLGGTLLLETKCHSLRRQGDRIVGVETNRGLFSAAITVNACGPWSKALAATAGIEVPLKIYREQETIWQCRHPEEMPACSISNAVDWIYLRPLLQGRFTIGRGFPKKYVEADPDSFNRSVDEEFIDDVRGRMERRFPALADARYLDGFASLYDVTPDWYPFIGPRKDIAGYADACGGSGHGFKLAPAIGRHLAHWIGGKGVPSGFERLSYDRVLDQRLFVQKYGGNRG